MMLPVGPGQAGRLDGTPVRIVSGARDPVVPPGDPERLAGLLRGAGAAVEVTTHPAAGHGPLPAELEPLGAWLQQHAARLDAAA
jgi:phospholipase/carboxylesterase